MSTLPRLDWIFNCLQIIVLLSLLVKTHLSCIHVNGIEMVRSVAPDDHLTSLYSTARKLSVKLANRKSQLTLLSSADCQVLNTCSSIRPDIGKVFSYSDLEVLKKQVLTDARSAIVPISIEEANRDIVTIRKDLNNFLIKSQDSLSRKDYIMLANFTHKSESYQLRSQSIKHNNKLRNLSSSEKLVPCKPEKLVKHKTSLFNKQQKRNKARRAKKRDLRKSNLRSKVNAIIDSGLVVNLSDVDVPDAAYLYLQKAMLSSPR